MRIFHDPPPSTMTTLHIRNMVCPRCIDRVRETLQELGLAVHAVRLGEAEVAAPPSGPDILRIDGALRIHGFQLLLDREEQTVERARIALLEYREMLETDRTLPRVSAFLERKLGVPSRKIGAAFAAREGITVERHLILLKIERVKELLGYGELTLSEIAYRLRYSSVQHLSAQFRTVTGVSVRDFKGGAGHRHPLDAVTGRP